ncbi:longevity assurance proteins LAG1/LAC1 [Fomitopsis serialis]|uniref:longevity assurance proteins LAG1/LAC1 n=1 Tax=Fomitopsis serialis TaxID=139415 RepID=UPI0020082D9E|nr:longevity assurance proteins LAG1/LAC1 [Neoantrodia serialis]KAH9938321.1 longevity assurance proteins LAG1/LAC1 [Neoantrodia serialis]
MNTDQAPGWLPSFLIPFVTLSYPTASPAVPDSFPDSSYYGTGVLDGCLIITFIAVAAILRDIIRLWILEPFARWKLTRDLMSRRRAKSSLARREKAGAVTNGSSHASHDNANGHATHTNGNGHIDIADDHISKRTAKKMHKSVLRFAEQGWDFIYFSFVWGLGLYVHYHLPTRVLDPIDVWLKYPHIPLAGPIKFYYLLETSFYSHQILVINAEARRKDHWQMMTHHVITVFLMVGSYFYNYTRVGCLVMFLMDWCDIWLPLAKMFRYMALSTLCDLTFVWFMVSWAVTRHWLFVLAILSAWSAMAVDPPLWDPVYGYFMTSPAILTFLSMLVALEVIQAMWFWLICRVAYRVISGKGAEDERSDDEG